MSVGAPWNYDEHNRQPCFGFRGVRLGAIPLSKLRRAVDGNRHRQYWHVDVQRGLGMAHDEPRSRSSYGIAGASCNDATHVFVCAFALPWLKKKLGADRLMAAGTLGTCVAMVLYGLAWEPLGALSASVLAGVSWIAVLSTLNVSAQVALPDWVRGRGLAIFVTVFFGAMTLGSAIWGELAGIAGLPATHLIASAGALAAIPLTWRWKLQAGADIDLTPSMHWPAPLAAQDLEHDRGPVLVTVE